MDADRSPWKALYVLFRMKSHHTSAVVFLFGFLFDIFTLPRIDHPAVPYLIGGHILIIGGSILLDRLLAERVVGRFERIHNFFPLAAAFSFGAVLSFLFIYYARSSAPGASWPFLLLLGAIMVGSELFRKKLAGLRFYVVLLCFLLILLSVLFVPIILGTITIASFFLSLFIGLALSGAYLFLLFLVSPKETRLILRSAIISIGMGALLLLLSYIFGIMPAIPLVLKEGDVYRTITRTSDGSYLLEGNISPWYTTIISPRSHEWTPGTPVYFYSAVFAPTDLSGTIVHEWQRKNAEGKWITMTRVSFPIRGGRANGYRGYSEKEQITEGSWRVRVILSDGRVIGRVPFTVRAVTQ